MISFELNQNHLESFNKNGFLIVKNFLDCEYLNKFKDRIDGLFKGNFETGIDPDEWNWKDGRDDPGLTRQICNAWKSDLLVRSLVCHSKIGEVSSNLMQWNGSRIIQDNILWKPSGGKTLSYHQDAAFNDWIIPQTMITCWISLDRTFINGGTLEYVKGSHKWGIAPPKGEFHSPKEYKKELEIFASKNNKSIEIEYIEIPAGGATFHHGLTWHGSGINNSSNDRRAIVTHSIPDDSVFHPSNTGGTGNIYKKYKKFNTNKLDESFFPITWNKKGYSSFENFKNEKNMMAKKVEKLNNQFSDEINIEDFK